jgi:citrate lyase subunit beta / citryl-CoA lyase
MSGDSGAARLISGATTFLFVPGDRPERFEKAFRSGADVIIIDLEDAVGPADKVAALANTRTALAGENLPNDFTALVRINDASDVEQLASGPLDRLLGIVIPKAESAGMIDAVCALLPASTPVIALIETARGVSHAQSIADHPRVSRLAFGAIDFAADVDATAELVFDVARAGLVIASRSAGKPGPIESPTPRFDDTVFVEAEARRARELGFTAKLCIHPAQIGPVNSGFAPTEAEIEWATRIVSLEGGAVQLDGAMVDKPVVDRAIAILERAKRSAS